jgi:maltose alpha-D-glucosyltransferase/alpha-amylase
MHLALAADGEDPNFAPEEFTGLYQRSLYQSMRSGTRRMSHLLHHQLAALPDPFRGEAEALLRREDEILSLQARILEHKISATRIRHHGDYHLGQVLNTGRDFSIIDFEGEPARPLSERRIKRSPLRDVAGMLRSFHYAAYTALAQQHGLRAGETENLEKWAEIWVKSISANFLEAYLSTAKGASFLPKSEKTLKMLIDAYLLEKAVYEVCYELNNRPEWIYIPVRGITRILDEGPLS